MGVLIVAFFFRKKKHAWRNLMMDSRRGSTTLCVDFHSRSRARASDATSEPESASLLSLSDESLHGCGEPPRIFLRAHRWSSQNFDASSSGSTCRS